MSANYIKDLKAFLSTPTGEPFIKEVACGTGQNYISNLRVTLSRVRATLKAQGRVIKPFKMIVTGIVPKPDDPSIHIVSIIRAQGTSQIFDQFKDLMQELVKEEEEVG